MFALPLPTAVGAFAPSALPDFYAIPTPIPNHPPFAQLPQRSLSHTRPTANVDGPRAVVAAWLILRHRVLLGAVCDPGGGGSRSSCKSRVPGQCLRCLAVSPFSGECLHRPALQLIPPLTATAPVACVNSQCFGHPNDILSGLTTGFSCYRFTSQPFLLPQLLLLDLDTGG